MVEGWLLVERGRGREPSRGVGEERVIRDRGLRLNLTNYLFTRQN